ncbi:MAG: MarR family transcriptional regulator, partial [Victivallales bacterium]|nr:MarR family transcriptional regulator [Victivallales bacterium]
QGRSKQRNRAIAMVFSQMGLIEGWGTGLQKIREQAKAYGLPPPQFLEMPSALRVNLYRRQLSSMRRPTPELEPILPTKNWPDGGMLLREGATSPYKTNTETNTETLPRQFFSATERTLLGFIKATPEITIDQMAAQSGLSRSGVQYALENLKRKGCLRRLGAQKNGCWQVIVSGVS